MTTNVTSPERKRRRYNGIVLGLYAVGIAGFFAGLFFEYALVGSVVYLLGVVGGVGSSVYVKRRTSITITDERDVRMAERGSYLAMKIFALVALAVFPVLFVLDAAGQFTFTPVAQGVLYLASALGLLWGGCCLAVKYVL